MRRVIALALLLCLATPAGAYRAGQTVAFHFTPRGLDGIAETPSWLKAYVWRGSTCVDSTKGFGVGPGGTLSGISQRSFNSKVGDTFYWTWDVPTAYGVTATYYTGILHVQVRYSMSGIVRDEDDAVPTLVPVNAATVDTLSADVVSDLVSAHSDATETAIEPGDYGATAVTSGGHNVPWATVQICRESNGTNVLNSAISDADGAYILRVPLRPAAADTFYIWARLGLRAVKSGEIVIVP